MIIYKSSFLIVHYDPKEALLHCDWHRSGKMNDDIYKNEIGNFTSCMKKHRADKVIFNSRHFDYIVIPKMQDWQARKILPEWNRYGVKKVVFLDCNDFFSQISIEQAFKRQDKVVSNFFWNKRKANEWLTIRN